MSNKKIKNVSLTGSQLQKITRRIFNGVSGACDDGFNEYEIIAGTQFLLGTMMEAAGIEIDPNAPVSEAMPLVVEGIVHSATTPPHPHIKRGNHG